MLFPDGLSIYLIYDYPRVFKNLRKNWITEAQKQLLFMVDGKEYLACCSDIVNLFYEAPRQYPSNKVSTTHKHISNSNYVNCCLCVVKPIGLQFRTRVDRSYFKRFLLHSDNQFVISSKTNRKTKRQKKNSQQKKDMYIYIYIDSGGVGALAPRGVWARTLGRRHVLYIVLDCIYCIYCLFTQCLLNF